MSTAPVTQRSVLDALEARYPDAARHDPRSRHAASAGRSCASSPASRTLHESPDTPLPEAVASGKEPLVVLGAIAGG